MNIPLSKRLLTCCSFIAQGDRVADVGCDHGYLGIYLLKNGIATSVIASDVKEMPLQSAKRNAMRFGVVEQIRFYLSDGVKNIPHDFDALVCAGMGADTIVSILESADWLRDNQYRLILQCQSKIPMLRQYLSEQGWHIRRETAVRDGRFLYTVMEVLWDPTQPKLSVGQRYFTPALLLEATADASAYYHDVLLRLQRTVSSQKDLADPVLIAALKELESMELPFTTTKEE